MLSQIKKYNSLIINGFKVISVLFLIPLFCGIVAAQGTFMANELVVHEPKNVPDKVIQSENASKDKPAKESLVEVKSTKVDLNNTSKEQANPLSITQNVAIPETSKIKLNPYENQTLGQRKKANKSQASTQNKDQSIVDSMSPVKTAIALISVLILIIFLAYLARKFIPGAKRASNNQSVEILSKTMIDSKQSLCLVRCGSRLLLVGLSPNHMAPLSVVDDSDEIAYILGQLESSENQSIKNSFNKLFHKESDKYDIPTSRKSGINKKRMSPENAQVDMARNELNGLLEKVKGLTHLRNRL